MGKWGREKREMKEFELISGWVCIYLLQNFFFGAKHSLAARLV